MGVGLDAVRGLVMFLLVMAVAAAFPYLEVGFFSFQNWSDLTIVTVKVALILLAVYLLVKPFGE